MKNPFAPCSEIEATVKRGRYLISLMAANQWSDAAREAALETRREHAKGKSIKELNEKFPTSLKNYDAKPSPEIESKISHATEKADDEIKQAVEKFSKTERTPSDWEHFQNEVKQAKKDFESNSDKQTKFNLGIEHSSGGHGSRLSESTYVTFDVSRDSDGESYFNTDTVRYSKHPQ